VSSIPPSDPAPLRHLGTGGSGPVRSPMIYGLVALLVLVALPLYLLRKPKPLGPPGAVAMRADVGDGGADAGAVESASLPSSDAGASKRVALGEPHTVRCSAKGGGRVMTERCDHLVSVEDALARSIRDNVACAPPATAPFSVSFVLTVDFERKKLHLWSGRSGTIKRRSSGDLIRCVEHALTAPDFATLAHQYAKYDINVMASYPATVASGIPLGGS
jgi:hypothetical protein